MAVSMTCANRKKKIITPVRRCRTQDHIPSRPRYIVPAGELATCEPFEIVSLGNLSTLSVGGCLGRTERGGTFCEIDYRVPRPGRSHPPVEGNARASPRPTGGRR